MKRKQQIHKIDLHLVVGFLRELKHLSEGIEDTIKSGDDGVERYVTMQAFDIRKAIDNFLLENMPLAKPGPVSNKKTYLDEASTALSKGDHDFTPEENVAIYMSRLHAFIIRTLKAQEDLSMIANSDLKTYIETTIIIGSDFEKSVYSNDWFYASFRVIDDIAEEMVQRRLKAPQLELFLSGRPKGECRDKRLLTTVLASSSDRKDSDMEVNILNSI